MKSKKKKIVYAVNVILTVLMVVVAILVLSTIIFSRINNQTPKLFNHTIHLIVSPSMEPEIKVGDLVFAKSADIEEVEEGNYVVFISPDPALNGKTIIHSVVKIEYDEDGKFLTTSGIREGATVDAYPVREILGIYKAKSTFLGKLFMLLINGKSLVFLLILFVALFLVVKYSLNVIKDVKKLKASEEENQETLDENESTKE